MRYHPPLDLLDLWNLWNLLNLLDPANLLDLLDLLDPLDQLDLLDQHYRRDPYYQYSPDHLLHHHMRALRGCNRGSHRIHSGLDYRQHHPPLLDCFLSHLQY